jgi:hypothetical protein
MSRSLTPQNPLSTNTISVSSANGFGAGDLVYQKSGDVGAIPNGTVTSGNFNVTATVKTIPASNIANTSTVVCVSTPGTGGGSVWSGTQAAKLSNGNIVIVYCNGFSGYRPYFRIIDENNNEIVAETAVSSSFTTCPSNQPVGVAAVTNGFVIVWTFSGTTNLCNIIYNNNGVTVIAGPTQDTSRTISGFYVTSKPDGGYAVVINDTSSANVAFRAFSASGVASFAWVTVAAYNSSSLRPVIAVRSDNTFVVAFSSTGSNISYNIYSSAGASVTSGTLTTSLTTTGFRLCCATLTNDDVIFFYGIGGPDVNRRRVLANNTLGGETTLGYAAYGATGVGALTGGGYALSITFTSSSSTSFGIFTSSDTNPNGFAVIRGLGQSGTTANNNFLTVLQLASNVALIGTMTGASNSSGFTVMAQIATATSVLRSFSTSSFVTGAVSSSTNNYAKSASTPNAAYFSAATSTTLTQTVPAVTGSTYTVSPTLIESAGVTNVYPKMMQNGQIVFGYATSSGQQTKLAVYSSTGVFVASYVVGSNSVSTVQVRMCVLGNGKLVMAWGSANNNVSFAVYSTSYALLASGTSQALFSITPSGTNSVTEGFDIAALSDSDRFVWTYSTGGQAVSLVINDALVLVQNIGVTGNGGQTGNKVVGAPNGGYVILQQFTSSGSATQLTSYYKSGASSYTLQYNYSVTGDNFNLGYVTPVAINAQGAVFAYVPRNGSPGSFYATDMANSNSLIALATVSNSGTTNQAAVATLTDGTFVAVRTDVNTPSYNVYAYSPYTTSQITATSITLSGGIGTASSPTPCVCPTFDNGFVCGYKASGDYPAFFIGSTISATYTQSIIAGTTVQNAPGLLPSPSNGYIFKGVAVTTATAGGSGVVQNLGSAQLNSQYPAGTTYQAFDSTGTVIEGTKGTITGRNVNMTGVA